MSADNPIDKANADLADLAKKIEGLENEAAKINNMLSHLYNQRERIANFVDLHRVYVGEIAKPAEHGPPEHPAKPNGATPLAGPKPRARSSKTLRNRSKIDRKPEGLPTTSDMIVEAVRDAKLRGKSGADPSDLTFFIQAKYWANAMSRDISPVAWRMWQDGKLKKATNGKYILPEGSH